MVRNAGRGDAGFEKAQKNLRTTWRVLWTSRAKSGLCLAGYGQKLANYTPKNILWGDFYRRELRPMTIGGLVVATEANTFSKSRPHSPQELVGGYRAGRVVLKLAASDHGGEGVGTGENLLE